MIKKPKPRSQAKATKRYLKHQDEHKPLIEHIHEIRKRLIWVVASLAFASMLGYAIHGILLDIIQKPLGQTLYYTSPVGGLNFLLKLCLTFGVIIALPVLIYQIVSFLRPVFSHIGTAIITKYLICSALLAWAGVAFAYFISLPAALHFLSNFGGDNITSLITADEYYTFALAYLGGFAVLFQVPVIILFINRIKPLKPGKMMKFQRYIIPLSFIIAAILTPTPDPINQAIMAVPAIVLYQLSLTLVWLVNWHRTLEDKEAVIPEGIVSAVDIEAVAGPALKTPQIARQITAPRRVITDFVPPQTRRQPNNPSRHPVRPQALQPSRAARGSARMIDNFIVQQTA